MGRVAGICWSVVALGLASLLGCAAGGPAPAAAAGSTTVEVGPLAMNRVFEMLPEIEAGDSQRAQLAAAGRALGDWTIHVAGHALDGNDLERWAAAPEDEPLLRLVREDVGRAVVLDDFLYFIDDVLVAGRAGGRGGVVWVTPGRGRRAGLLVHPQEVFEGRPRRYGEAGGLLDLTAPRPQTVYPPARDGEPPGPNWTMRFRNPSSEGGMLAALQDARPSSDFARRLEDLMGQLRAAGATVQLASTVRHRERGYLMWGAFELGRQLDAESIEAMCVRLDERNAAWRLDVPIVWRHPAGWQATKDAAKAMADTYEVVYATEAGARASSHYGGGAVDLTVVALPRTLELEAPSGERRRFDLSDPNETRELSLTPQLIEWVEAAFGFEKLRADYPHWNDSR